MVREVPVGDLIVGQQLFLQIEAIERLPCAAGLGLHYKLFACFEKAERLVWRGLLDVGLEPQRPRERHATEADISNETFIIQIDAKQHVATGGDRAFGCVPQNARREAGHLKAEGFQRMAEKKVLLETIAAATVAHDFLLKRQRIKSNRPFQQRVEVLKRNRLRVPNMDGAQGFERGCALARVIDPLKVGLEVERRRRGRSQCICLRNVNLIFLDHV